MATTVQTLPKTMPVSRKSRLLTSLLVVQIIVGFEFLWTVLVKHIGGAFVAGLGADLKDRVQAAPHWYQPLADSVIIPNATLFAYLVLIGELFVGITVIVDVLHDAQNPGGLVSEVKVAAVGPNKSIAKPNADGTMTVTLGDTRQAVAYQLTNEIDKLSATAFITVPAYSDSAPPRLKSTLKLPQVTAMNTAISWKLSDILDVPSGRAVKVTDAGSASAGRQAAGVPMVPDTGTIVYTPEKDFRGNTIVTFKVSDKGLTDDPNATTIEIPVTVGDASFRDIAPTFANQTIEIQPGEAPKTFDLRGASSHPNPAVIQELTYQNFAAPSGPIKASLAGSTVSMSTDVSTPVGTKSVIKFNVGLGSAFSVPAQITVKVVKSTRPLPQTVDDAEPNGRSSTTYTISPLANDFNPFADQGKPLKVTDVAFQGDNLGASGLTRTDSTVSVTTGTAKSGTINLIYTVRDATDSADREVQGRIVVTVTSAPEPVTSFTLSNTGSQTVSVIFQPPVSSNGAQITGYTVRINGGPSTNQRTDCSPGASCTFTGRTNGSVQTVDVAATNNVGTTWSNTRTITPYGTPSTPTNPVINTNSPTATATITPSWSGPADSGGGAITYQWNFTQGSSASGSTSGTSGGGQNVGAGDYTFQVRACNPGGCSAYATSATRHINPPPMVVTIAKGARGNSATCTSTACYYIAINASGFAANTTYTVSLETDHYADGSKGAMAQYGTINITMDSSGSYNNQVSPYGYPGYDVQVSINGVSSNIVAW